MEKISLDDLCGGALLQKFTMEMMKIGQNIRNPNTDSKKARKLTITLTFKPDESRQVIQTSIETKSSLAPLAPVSTSILLGEDLRSGMISMTEYGNDQNRIRMAGEQLPVQAEVIRPQRQPAYDAETGEIYDAVSDGPVDLRRAQ